MPTSVINEKCKDGKSIGLNRIKKLGYSALSYSDIKNEINAIIQKKN